MKVMAIHGILAALGLLMAWRLTTTEAEEGRSEEQVSLFACDVLQEADYQSPGRSLRVERKSDDAGSFYWLTVTPKAPGAGGEETPEGAPTPKPSEYLVSDGEDAESWFERLQPLTAIRSLGEVKEDLLGDLGIDDNADTLSLTCGNGKKAYRIGSATFGSQPQRYLQEQGKNEVLLIDRETVNQLAQADSRLARRALHDFETSDVARLQVRGEEQSITLLQRDRHDPRAAVWVDAAKPDERNDLYGNWMTHVHALSVRAFLPAGGEPGSDVEEADAAAEPEVVLSLEYFGDEETSLGTLSMVRLDDSAAATARYYGKSRATRGWVTLPYSVARQVENNSRLVLGLDPLPEPMSSVPEATSSGDATETGPAPASPVPSAHPTPATTPGLPPGHP